jgi:hypothetical protein
MNDNTILRIKVPAHLYESVKEQLTLKEAARIHIVTTMDGKTIVGTHQDGIGFKANEKGKQMGFIDDPKVIPSGTKMQKPNGTKMQKGDSGLNEAKGKQNLGAGMEVVNEKKATKAKAPKAKQAKAPETKDDAPHDGMNKIKKKERTLDELKAAHKALTEKIKSLEEYRENDKYLAPIKSSKPEEKPKDKEPIKEYSNELYQWYPDVEECWQVDDEGNQIQEVSIEYCQRKSERR